jgi:hypothetical protein
VIDGIGNGHSEVLNVEVDGRSVGPLGAGNSVVAHPGS